MPMEKPGTVWAARARLYNRSGKLMGYCTDTPNGIAKAMMEHPSIAKVRGLFGTESREAYASRMKAWNIARSHYSRNK